ncbi:hypothetical protein SAMN02745196_01224 [Clostridium collagenovorans DSM 3089]|uniref:Phage head-tail adapter protein n=1 Tax=Clostridium collagenovorans DSM 3089 TaxID=1121306 RepID=A0A1M5VCB3_9CLOT|nr:phage head-tail adapter protein [Clostridium collagenovorans]SHH72877.1 hypothetical protein SAMN02745196_01224 [Clostridium collagenovorans DSM 3089]
MNKEWSELNKKMQLQIKKKETFRSGIDTLITLREKLMKQIFELKEILSIEEFYEIPFINADGYHSKTISYSLYHVFRIEDIVANSLIRKDMQIFFEYNYQNRMNSSIITTGNELVKQEIAAFSAKLNLDELYKYIIDVDKSTRKLLYQLNYQNIKIKMTEQDKEILRSLRVVSEDKNSIWLIDYWCNKNVQGLIHMAFSRHWIMHIEASIRIKNKIHTN